MGYTHGNVWNDELIKEKIYKVISILNIDYMPSSSEVRQTKISGLDGAITRTGGYIEWAKKLNLSPKKPIIKRTKEDIFKELKLIINELKLNRMPSRSEIIECCGDNSLHNAIVRSGGYYKWAEVLNLKIKKSETLMGLNYEQVCAKYLTSKNYKVETTSIKAPYDLLVNNNIRIDVKSGCAYDLSGNRVHTFGINKKDPTCDIYVLYGLNEDGIDIEKTFIIPSKNLKITTLSVGRQSKYNKYIDKWDYIDQYDKFYKTIK